MTRDTFKSLLSRPEPLITPMVYDALSARMAANAGFKAVGLSGSGLLAVQHALPDVGLAGLGEMLDGGRQVVRGCDLPWGTDIDDGFGDAKSVVNAIRSLERVGCGQVVIEDQDGTTKKPGDAGADALVTPTMMAAKVRAAVSARQGQDMIIMARTDAASIEGLDAAIARAETYLSAGADGAFIAGLKTPEDLRRVGEALRGSLLLLAVPENRIRAWPAPAELHDMGFAQLAYPSQLITRMVAAVQGALDELARFARGELPPADMPNFESATAALARHLRLDQWLETGRTYDGR